MQGGLRTRNIFKNSNNSKPLISVITVVLNGEKYLEETISSVLKQTYENVEYILIDGKSTDRTLDIIQKYDHLIDFWVSEKDSGIYNAMNKGITLSRGDFVGFVGSDDYLYTNTLTKLANAARKGPIDYTVGPVDLIKKNKKFHDKISILPNFLENKRFIYDMATHHLSFYINKKIINKLGVFDEKFKIRSDFDMTISVISMGKNYYKFPDSVGAFRQGGVSGSYQSYFETYYILRKHGISMTKSISNVFLSIVKLFIIKNFPSFIVKWLRKNFSSGRYIG